MENEDLAGTRWLSRTQLARYLDVAPSTIERLAADGKLTKYRIDGGSIVRYRKEEVDNLFHPIGKETDPA